ncbi:hypothetical protein COX69_03295 [Candidatus Falkowbacteria bacterium CG_4_10_14_0_2_um_filter_48_10]|nr:MAG: hypothetical protein COX69_03295 [Candidatus Falkowbacteria bacterium CG_4_10_14_0_2_um_filter_48_10]
MAIFFINPSLSFFAQSQYPSQELWRLNNTFKPWCYFPPRPSKADIFLYFKKIYSPSWAEYKWPKKGSIRPSRSFLSCCSWVIHRKK